VLSVLWAVAPGFGVIDLDAALPPGDPDFRRHWFLEGSWGLFITALIVVPLLVVVLCPRGAWDAVSQLAAVACCGVVAGVMCLDVSFVLFPAELALTAWVVWLAIRAGLSQPTEPGAHGRRLPLVVVCATYIGLAALFGPDAWTLKIAGILLGMVGLAAWLAYAPSAYLDTNPGMRRSWPLLVMALVAAGPWIAYAANMAEEFRSGLRYTSSNIDRITGQTAFVWAVAALPVLAGLGRLRIRMSIWTAAVAGVGFGSFAVIYPHHLASPGAGWGIAAIAWSAAMVGVAEGTLWRTAKAAIP
jgi:hypothetical protein